MKKGIDMSVRERKRIARLINAVVSKGNWAAIAMLLISVSVGFIVVYKYLTAPEEVPSKILATAIIAVVITIPACLYYIVKNRNMEQRILAGDFNYSVGRITDKQSRHYASLRYIVRNEANGNHFLYVNGERCVCPSYDEYRTAELGESAYAIKVSKRGYSIACPVRVEKARKTD